ncbi:hypothetical protein LOC67_00830 [Stieleria sp. JC731]|uniref:hypothetical protein n=1 Tax=Pirellulaceae TaxID=2691357 RepID=UPI001E51C6C2|nr:hypothetical protein [Stieleria sp. JC731]MCC9599086.1 hypothetical protein [Stieleria sp. JC731]
MICHRVSLIAVCLVHFALVLSPAEAKPRLWTSVDGNVTIEGEFIASDETTAILKRKGSGRLVAVELSELSPKDREVIRELLNRDPSEVAIVKDESQADKDAEHMQTWKSRDGMKIQARVISYGKKDYTLAKQRGVITINGKAFSALDSLHQHVALKVLSKIENTPLEDERDLKRFVGSLGGQPKTYPLEGVLMELASGDQIAVPFFMFSDSDLEILKTGWENWQQTDGAAKSREDLMMRSEAMDYQRSIAQQAEYQRMEMLKLNMLAAQTGLISIWEVQLKPNPAVYGRPVSVMVSAHDSNAATQMVLPNYPGYSLIGVRKASRL